MTLHAEMLARCEAENAKRIALLQDSANQVRIALLEELQEDLDRAGFACHAQVMFGVERDDNHLHLILHAGILSEHAMAGTRELYAHLDGLGVAVKSMRDGDLNCVRAGSEVKISVHADRIGFYGWKPPSNGPLPTVPGKEVAHVDVQP